MTLSVLGFAEMIVARRVVPGHLPKMHAKALDAGADEVVFDLEDAVALDAKAAARRVLAETLRRPEWSARPSGKEFVTQRKALPREPALGPANLASGRLPRTATLGHGEQGSHAPVRCSPPAVRQSPNRP